MKDPSSETLKKIGPSTKIGSLLKEFPFLLDTFIELSPHFKQLKNPILRKSLAKVATLKTAATMGSLPLERILEAIATAVREQTGRELEIEGAAVMDAKRERLDTLKGIILALHAGENVEEAKARFSELVKDVSAVEIAEMEQELISEGLPAEDVKSLCDVHVAMFQESLDGQTMPETTPGHPLHTFLMENKAILKVIGEIESILTETDGKPDPVRHGDAWGKLNESFEQLATIEKHYQRKEYQLFPVLESKNFSGPSQVMWAIHDDIRAMIKEVKESIAEGNAPALAEKLPPLLQTIRDMINKEESILFPTSIDLLEHEDWAKIHKGEAEIGYTLITPGNEWNPRIKINYPPPKKETPSDGDKKTEPLLDLKVGKLTLEQINLMLLHLPVEISFVDENDEVRYYTGLEEKIFPRSEGVIGRKVQNCHPPKSVHLVNRILKEFRDGSRDLAEFWIRSKGKLLHIQYFAVRDENGTYRGTLETVQDVTHIRELEGEKRLLDTE